MVAARVPAEQPAAGRQPHAPVAVDLQAGGFGGGNALRGAGMGDAVPGVTRRAVLLQSGQPLQPQASVRRETEREHAVIDGDARGRLEPAAVAIPPPHALRRGDPGPAAGIKHQRFRISHAQPLLRTRHHRRQQRAGGRVALLQAGTGERHPDRAVGCLRDQVDRAGEGVIGAVAGGPARHAATMEVEPEEGPALAEPQCAIRGFQQRHRLGAPQALQQCVARRRRRAVAPEPLQLTALAAQPHTAVARHRDRGIEPRRESVAGAAELCDPPPVRLQVTKPDTGHREPHRAVGLSEHLVHRQHRALGADRHRHRHFATGGPPQLAVAGQPQLPTSPRQHPEHRIGVLEHRRPRRLPPTVVAGQLEQAGARAHPQAVADRRGREHRRRR